MLFRPTFLTLLFTISGLAIDFMFGSWTYFSDQETIVLGIGEIIEIGSNSGTSIKWIGLAITIFATYVVSAIIAHLLLALSKLQRPQQSYFFLFLSVLGASCCIASYASKNYWGYYFYRPDLPPSFTRFEEITAFSSLTTKQDDNGFTFELSKEKPDLKKELHYTELDPYYGLNGRMLKGFQEEKLANASSDVELTGLYQYILRSGLLIPSDPGYNSATSLSGIAIQGLDKKGKIIIALGIRGGQVFNDHYPWYEIVLERKSSSSFSVIESQQFFYDVAGIEEVEWLYFFIGNTILGIVFGFPLFALSVFAYRIVRWYRLFRL